MLSLALSAVALLSALLPTTLAQTYTSCNPLNTTGCPDMPALGGNTTFKFNTSLYDEHWTQPNQGKIDWNENGATFTVAKSGDSPLIQSKFYLFFGRMEVVMKAAPGQGIISSAVLQSDCRDEIDWEFMGSKSIVATAYFGKGNNTWTPGRGADFDMSPPQDNFHNYTFDWTRERIQWWLDGKMIRELKKEDAEPGGDAPSNYPQTPSHVRLGAWAAGDVTKNHPDTVKWAGGETDFKKGPYAMTVRSLYVKDYTSAKEYTWDGMDASGAWEKVTVVAGKSETMKEIEKPRGLKAKWNALPKAAQIAIFASSVGVVTILLALLLFCCIKQRRAGRREIAAYEAQQNKEAAELLEYKKNHGYNRL